MGFLHSSLAIRQGFMNPDGISYLDVGEAWLKGDWEAAVSAYWSPLYAWILALALRAAQPSPRWEFPVVHVVNFAIYVFALVCFAFFWRELMRRRLEDDQTFPSWAWIVLGLALFLWSSVVLVEVRHVSPDMVAAGFVYLAAGSLLRLRDETRDVRVFLLLGLALGLGYLARAAAFPLAFVFLAVCFAVTRKIRGTLLATAVFLLLAAPLAATLSVRQERPTFGDSGRLNYAWYVNGVPRFHWRGETTRNGEPQHPTRRLSELPPVYEFGTPINGTYPPWYDPVYWNEGIRLRFDLHGQLEALARTASSYYEWFVRKLGGLLAVVLVLYGMSGRRGLGRGGLASWWVLLLPALAALGMYALVYVEGRHVAPYIVMLCAGVLAGVRLPESLWSPRLASVTVGVAVAVTFLDLGTYTVKTLDGGPGSDRDPPWEVAGGLREMGVRADDPVAYVGPAVHETFWARLARVRIVAEMYAWPTPEFWANESGRRATLRTLAAAGPRVIVAREVPPGARPDGWHRIAETGHFLLVLDDESGR
ncbi:MAG: hypothetical protein ACREK5_02540 [Gemmatimonadota bacterium]